MRYWFEEHGEPSGRHRVRGLGLSDTWPLSREFVCCEVDTRRSPAKYERAVFEGDHYTCRYCGLPDVAKEVLSGFEKVVGVEAFRTTGTNAQQHGVIHAFKLVADHVIPHKLGGKTNLDNLVTACPACNYGKDCYTLEQLGLEDPRNRPPEKGDWDGLTAFVPGLKANGIVSSNSISATTEPSSGRNRDDSREYRLL
jgi:5-methylcytosine-specific restriction endonuclease McrA